MHQTTYTEESKDFITFIYQLPKDQSLAEGKIFYFFMSIYQIPEVYLLLEGKKRFHHFYLSTFPKDQSRVESKKKNINKKFLRFIIGYSDILKIQFLLFVIKMQLFIFFIVPTVALLNMEGFVCHVTPALNEWFNYTPTLKKKSTKKESQVSLDLALAEATSPLQRQVSKGEDYLRQS